MKQIAHRSTFAALVAASLAIGCSGGNQRLVAAPTADQPADKPQAASEMVNRIRVTATPGTWPGSSLVNEQLTPLQR